MHSGSRAASHPLALLCATALLALGVSAPAQAQNAAPAQPQRPPQAQPDGAPPPARELTPAEISALQTMMTDRANGTVLTPANAQAIRNRMLETQGMLPPVGGFSDKVRPKPRSIYVDPQSLAGEPDTIQLALGVVTPLTFLDTAGRAWPVESVAFDPRMFAEGGNGCGAAAPPNTAVAGAGERPSSITIMPCRINTWGNVSIKLEGYALPVVLMAKSGGNSSVDLPITVRVKGRSPSAPMTREEQMAAYSAAYSIDPNYAPRQSSVGTVGNAGPGRDKRAGKGRGASAGRTLPDRYMDTFSAGAPPANAQRVTINDSSVDGWLLNGKLYLRGPVTVVNPAQDAVAENADGMKVWRFDRPVPRVLVIDSHGTERDLTVDF